MDYASLKEILQGVSNSESKDYPSELDKIIEETAESGIVRFSWNLLRPLLRARLQRVLDRGFEGQECSDDERLCDHLLDRLDLFDNPPFTIQRVCELIIEPKKHYKKIGAFMRAMERNLLVVSTQEPDLSWMKNPRLTQLLGEPVNGPSRENFTHVNFNEQNSMNSVDHVCTQNPDSTPHNSRHQTDPSGSHSGAGIDLAEVTRQDQQMDFESSITRISRKRKSCDREVVDDEDVNPFPRDGEESRTVLQEADSTTTTDTDHSAMELDTSVHTDDNVDDLETVAKRLKPLSAEGAFPGETPNSDEPTVKGAQGDDWQVSSALGRPEQVQNESTGQSERTVELESNGSE